MIDEERQRATDKAFQDLGCLVEKNGERFGSREFRLNSFDDAVQHLKLLVAKSKRKLEGLDCES